MKYLFNKGTIDYPDGSQRIYPYVSIENSQDYGSYFESEITHLGSNLDYIKEIVDKIESLLNGKICFYEGFGFEAYIIECSRDGAKVINIFDNYTVEAKIPIREIYELMRDWRDYLIEWNNKKK